MKKLEFCQNTFDIDPHGILIWSKLNTAIVSDLHLEKGSSYAKYGQYIPPYDSLETLIKLEKILSNYVIKKIIFLGDTFHLTFFFKSDEENLYTFFSLHIYALKSDFK